jgi:ABC-2 type transport system ATP-binding protein
MPVIDISHLKKSYGKHLGTKDVTFSVEEGEIFGFVGPNGAGKSTTIRILLNFIFADEGNASVCGLDCAAKAREIKKFTGMSRATCASTMICAYQNCSPATRIFTDRNKRGK